ncbi:NAD(P)-dependent alcohol dehydrogenase [Candidatus Gracilibacteria bacterium]|nr:NAD(P)-dependent alcohol dehydrogenase [Candidatus Gracilibacteria bacterium]
MTMHAIGFRRYGDETVLEQLTMPLPSVGEDTVVIRVVAAAVNPADWRLRSGQLRLVLRLKLPFVCGADVAGVVAEVGPQVTRFRPGDAVYALLATAAGGGYAEYAAAPESSVAHAPSRASFKQAAATPLVGLTALQALRDQAQIKAGQRLLVYGASGGVGSCAVQIGRALGASVSAATSGRNREIVASLGVDEVFDYTHDDITKLHERFDVIFDAVNALSLRRVQRALKPNGLLVTVNPLSDKFAPDWLAGLRGGRRLRSVLVRPDSGDLDQLRRWIDAGTVHTLIDRCYPLADAAVAQQHSASGRARGKLVLLVDPVLADTPIAERTEGVNIAPLATMPPAALPYSYFTWPRTAPAGNSSLWMLI